MLGGTPVAEDLPDPHFIRLRLTEGDGNILSENFYGRGKRDRRDFTALNSLPQAQVKVSSKLVEEKGRATITAVVSNPKSAPVAFAVNGKPGRTSDGERILTVLMNDNYFTLMPGETRTVTMECDAALLEGGSYRLVVEPYNR